MFSADGIHSMTSASASFAGEHLPVDKSKSLARGEEVIRSDARLQTAGRRRMNGFTQAIR
jgi:hypothetical protein